MTPTLYVRAADIQDAERLAQFRTVQYESAKEFILQDYELLKDMSGVNIIVEHDDAIIATMQFNESATKAHFEALSDIPLHENEVAFKTLYIGRAGTDRLYRKMGLNSLIRKYILLYALEHDAIQSFTASVYETAPRLRLLTRLGYRFRVIPGYYPDYLTDNECYLVYLPRTNFEPAFELMQIELQNLLEQYQVHFIPWW